MKKVFALIIAFNFSIFISNGQMDQPVTLKCLNPSVVRSDIRSIKPIDPPMLITTPVNQVGEHIPGLIAKDFEIRKGKKVAEILDVKEIKTVESTVMRIVFVIDNSQSMSPYLDVLKSTLEKVIRNFSSAVRVSILFFNETDISKSSTFQHDGTPLPVVRLPYTSDKERAVTYIKRMLVEPDLSRSTYLYDEVYASLSQIKADTGKVDKSFAIVFSDGQDNASSVKAETDIYEDKLETTFYTIDYLTESNDFLVKLADQTHGEHFIAKSADDLVKVFESIASKIVAKGYEITYKFKGPPTATIKSSTKELVMEEEIVRETFPLLNYIFFDQGSAAISDKYVRLKSENVSAFDESAIEGGALDFYYSALNIIGSRMRKIPSSSIILTGCINNVDDEKNNTRLATDRANAVKYYLTTLWGIEENRIQITASKLPSVPSSSKDEDGRSENRRVEITSDNWEILKPVTFVRRIATVQPASMTFHSSANIPEGLATCTLNIEQSGRTFDSRSGENLEPAISWNWKNTKSEYPNSKDELTFNLAVMDKAGDSYITTKEKISVREVKKERLKNVELEGGITKEKISLILFEFDKSDMGPKNDQIMNEFVYPRLNKISNVKISGYTDRIGSDEYNQALSERRAKAVYDVLLKHEEGKLDPQIVQFAGYGKTQPIFSNDIPEGRFYNRTVSLMIEK